MNTFFLNLISEPKKNNKIKYLSNQVGNKSYYVDLSIDDQPISFFFAEPKGQILVTKVGITLFEFGLQTDFKINLDLKYGQISLLLKKGIPKINLVLRWLIFLS
jgi:hypothetical protein